MLLAALAACVALPVSCRTADIFDVTFDFGAVADAASLEGGVELCANAGTPSMNTTPTIGAAITAIFLGRLMRNSLLESACSSGDPTTFAAPLTLGRNIVTHKTRVLIQYVKKKPLLLPTGAQRPTGAGARNAVSR